MDTPWFNFCGLFSGDDLGIIVNDIRRPIGPTITENVQEIPGMTGNLFQGNSYSSKSIEIDITIPADTVQELIRKYHELADLFVQTGDGEFPMIFYDEPDYTYYGHFVNLPTPTRPYSKLAQVTLGFTCSDPLAYGEQKDIKITQSPQTIIPNGTAEENPIFTCIPNKDVSKIAVTDQDGNYAYIGEDVDPETGEAPIDKEPRVFHDDCNTLALWEVVTTPTFTVENAVVNSDASMSSTPDAITIGKDSNGYANFGKPVKGKYYGALRQQMFPASYPDYRIRIRLYNTQHDPAAKGKIEVYLLDSEKNRIGRVYLKDNGAGEDIWCLAEIGDTGNRPHHELYYGQGTVKKGKSYTKTVKVKNGTKTITSKGKSKTVTNYETIKLSENLNTGTFTNFYGYIEIQKIGNVFRCEIQKLDQNANPAKGWKPVVRTYKDTKGQFNRALAGVALFIGKFGIAADFANPVYHYENNHMGLCDITVNQIIDGGNGASTAPSIIARAGDEIKINCEDGHIYKNGGRFMGNFYIGSNFPKMKGGVPNTYGFYPSPDEAKWSITYRPTRM